jgi:hypothetical protein
MLRSNPGFFQASLSDPWDATHQTVQYMARLIHDSEADSIINNAAQSALRRFGVMADVSTPAGRAASVWWFAKRAIKFVHHQKLLRAWLGKADELQLLISPDVLLKMEQPKGDCAVFTCLICAMLECLSVPWEIVTVAVDPNQPDVFSHVYPRAILREGYCLPLDASHGKYPGWEVPAQRVLLKQVWDSHGEPIEDQDSGFRGLHGLEGGSVGLEGFQLNGLGQDDGTDTGVDLSGATYGPTDTQLGVPSSTGTYYDSTTGVTYDSAGNVISVGTPSTPISSAPSTSNTELASILANFGAAWTKIAGQVIAPQVTETGPGGTSITGPASALQSILGSGTVSLGGTNVNILMLAGIAIGALLLISSLGKK